MHQGRQKPTLEIAQKVLWIVFPTLTSLTRLNVWFLLLKGPLSQASPGDIPTVQTYQQFDLDTK